mmetsp:Transcript_45730/g.103053  ORF Transcript_45730/g.103053 Transcript_45730/m.103053 type:complete len:222 (-) Transcript_45730:552-1217(-)
MPLQPRLAPFLREACTVSMPAVGLLQEDGGGSQPVLLPEPSSARASVQRLQSYGGLPRGRRSQLDGRKRRINTIAPVLDGPSFRVTHGELERTIELTAEPRSMDQLSAPLTRCDGLHLCLRQSKHLRHVPRARIDGVRELSLPLLLQQRHARAHTAEGPSRVQRTRSHEFGLLEWRHSQLVCLSQLRLGKQMLKPKDASPVASQPLLLRTLDSEVLRVAQR